MRTMFGLMFFCLVVIVLGGCGLKEEYFPNCSESVTESPETYPKNSELFYLSWIEHGDYSSKASAARHLVELPSKVELNRTERIYSCQDVQIVRNMLAVALFDLDSNKHLNKAKSLLNDKDRDLQTETEGSWVKAGRDFDGEDVDFYFDWGGEAARRLLSKGYYTTRGRVIVLQLAQSFYPDNRKEAAAVLSLFAGMPSLDLTKQPETINENPWAEQIGIVEKWFEENENRLKWDADLNKYRLK